MHKVEGKDSMKISQQLVADLAGVSRGTVDRVINGKPNVRPETKQRVLDAIEELRYSPNAAGRALALCNRAYSIAVVCPGPEVPFFADVLEGVRAAEKELGDFNLSVRTFFTHGRPSEEVFAELAASPAQAFMIAAEDSPTVREAVSNLTRRGFPVVTFNTDIEACGRLCFVGQDLQKSGRIAGGLMLKLVRREPAKVIVIAGNHQFQAHKARIDGFSDTIRATERKIEIAGVLETDDEQEKTYRALSNALQSCGDIEGIYLASGHIEGAVRAIRETGKKYAVIANDLSPAIEAALKENIFDFTIYQNPFEQGHRPVRILFDCLLNGALRPDPFYDTGAAVLTREML